MIPNESATASGIVINLVKVDNGAAGKLPTITFTLKDRAGKPIDPSTLVTSPSQISFVMAGPTADYGNTTLYGRHHAGLCFRSRRGPCQVRPGRHLHLHLYPRGADGRYGDLRDRRGSAPRAGGAARHRQRGIDTVRRR